MSNQKKIVSKGYTVTATSWENDGDYYNTKSKTYDTKEEALLVYEGCLMCSSTNTGSTGLGNVCDADDFTAEQNELMVEFCKKHNLECGEENPSWIINDRLHEVIGSSEYYEFRVVENVDIFYSDKDIFIDLMQP